MYPQSTRFSCIQSRDLHRELCDGVSQIERGPVRVIAAYLVGLHGCHGPRGEAHRLHFGEHVRFVLGLKSIGVTREDSHPQLGGRAHDGPIVFAKDVSRTECEHPVVALTVEGRLRVGVGTKGDLERGV